MAVACEDCGEGWALSHQLEGASVEVGLDELGLPNEALLARPGPKNDDSAALVRRHGEVLCRGDVNLCIGFEQG